MKNAKVLKALLLSAAAVMLVVATVFATMAYLVSSAAVSNVFTVGNVSLLMYETKVNPDGTPVDPDFNPNTTMKTADVNSYHLQPAVTYKKDPTVYVAANSDEAYLFVRLRNDLKKIEDPDKDTIVEQLRANGWLEIERADNNVDAIFVYVGTKHGTDGEGNPITLTKRYNDATKVVDKEAADNGLTLTHSQRTKNILAKLSDIKAKPVGNTKDATYPIVHEPNSNTNYQAIDVFRQFAIDDGAGSELSAYGGARVAIVAYAIQANGIGDANKAFSQESFLAAWKLLQEKLPYGGGATTN